MGNSITIKIVNDAEALSAAGLSAFGPTVCKLDNTGDTEHTVGPFIYIALGHVDPGATVTDPAKGVLTRLFAAIKHSRKEG